MDTSNATDLELTTPPKLTDEEWAEGQVFHGLACLRIAMRDAMASAPIDALQTLAVGLAREALIFDRHTQAVVPALRGIQRHVRRAIELGRAEAERDEESETLEPERVAFRADLDKVRQALDLSDGDDDTELGTVAMRLAVSVLWQAANFGDEPDRDAVFSAE